MKFNFLIPCIALLLPIFCQANGLTLGATRLIYEASKKEASIPLRNRVPNTPHLVQSWVSDFDTRSPDNIPFITTPPLFKLAAESETFVRVVYIGNNQTALPDNRESLFLLNVRAIPAIERQKNPARMTVATQMIIKLIYRPEGLTAKDAASAGDKLEVSVNTGHVTFRNPTPYVITLTGVTINDQKIERPGILRPFTSREISKQAGAVRQVTWSIINDWGGITPSHRVNF